MSKKLKNSLLLLISLLIINICTQSIYKRIDVTEDHRFTLSKTSKNIISKVNEPLFITVYLEGDFPSEFKRLQLETRQHLEELTAENALIKFKFETPDQQQDALIKRGMIPSKLTVEEAGKFSEAIIFPWAETLQYGQNSFNWENYVKQTCDDINCIKLINLFNSIRFINLEFLINW